MKLTNIIILLLFYYLVGCDDLHSDNVGLQGEIVRYGIYKSVSIDSRTAEPSTAAGFTSIGKSELISSTDIVNAKINLGIGFEYKIYLKEITDNNKIELVLTHPKITNNDGKIFTISRHYRALPDKPGLYGSEWVYFFRQDFELAPGDWNFQILYEKKLILEKKFKVSL